MTATQTTHSNIAKRFRSGDILEWAVYDAGPPNIPPAFHVNVIVLSAGTELYVMLHPGEDVGDVRESFNDVGVDIEELKSGPVYVFDCVQYEDCTLVARYPS
jgi:hypothetical protein